MALKSSVNVRNEVPVTSIKLLSYHCKTSSAVNLGTDRSPKLFFSTIQYRSEAIIRTIMNKGARVSPWITPPYCKHSCVTFRSYHFGFCIVICFINSFDNNVLYSTSCECFVLHDAMINVHTSYTVCTNSAIISQTKYGKFVEIVFTCC